MSTDSKLKAESELSRLERLRSDLAAEHHALEGKYRALQQTLEEMQKKMEDGKAAHQEDVTKERVRYEELKAIQDSLKERYQTGDLVSILTLGGGDDKVSDSMLPCRRLSSKVRDINRGEYQPSS